MSDQVIREIENLEKLHRFRPAQEADVAAAEKALALRFAEDYRNYLLHFGTVLAQGIALTGLGGIKRLDVVQQTLQQRSMRKDFPTDMYVLEDIGVDGIIFLQREDGTVYGLRPGGSPQKTADSLCHYLRLAKG